MIIGITGTNGAGKGTVVDYLVKQKRFTHYSARDFIIEEIKRRGLEVHRDSTRAVGNDLRAQHGADYIIRSLFERAKAAGGDAVIESVREVPGAEFLKAHGALLWGVDADRLLRYERSVGRATELDKISFEKFCQQEDAEWASNDPAKHNGEKVLQMANVVLTNSGAPEELYQQVEGALRRAGVQ